MALATRRELLEAGVHFGHQTRRWNPKMRRFIFGERSGIYIIDLEKTRAALDRTHAFLLEIAGRGGTVLFVGTKKQAQETVAEQATRVGMPYVNTRWLGGMLTNFQTIHARLKRLKELREMERSGAFEFLPKKEVLKLRHEKDKLERNLSGLQEMERLPDAIFVIDTKREQIAVKEARKLGIPIIAIVDTNCDPDEVDYAIPGNDDAIRSCSMITRLIADALAEGQYLAYQGMSGRTFEPDVEAQPAAATEGDEGRRGVRLSEAEAAFFGEDVAEGEAVPGAPEEAAGVETSATWAAPARTADLEADTVPSVAGEVSDTETIEAEIDHTFEPAGGPGAETGTSLPGEDSPPEGRPSGDDDRDAEEGR